MGGVNECLPCSQGKELVLRYQRFVQGSKVPLIIGVEGKQICCKGQISVEIAPLYLIGPVGMTMSH